ncbi:MAG: hypothetical protein Kow0098_17660 [Ignavibacteriaceae bacterium]
MSTGKLYSVAAVFDKPDQIINAAETVSSSGYTKFDVNTPYPVHGMDKAMKMKPSKLGFVTLFFGLSGAAIALLFMYWTMSVDYPIVIGGKPFFSLPAFIPVTFEVTVLLATLSTVIAMLAFFFNLPQNSHPLHDTDYMKAVSCDKYGIFIEAADPKFDLERLKNLFSELSASAVYEIYYPEKITFPVFEKKFIIFLILIAIITSGATYFTLNKILYITPFDWMMEQPKLTPQESSILFPDGSGMRTPVEGTIARGFIPYQFKGTTEPPEVLDNPLLPTPEVLELGKKKFLTFCSPCHGNNAEGDSRLRGQFPNPPTLHSDRARGFSDGMIFHIITNGQNTMPAYESQILPDERWAIVHYVRVLQRSKNASETDVIKSREVIK